MKKTFTLLVILLVTANFVAAQTAKIKGSVTDADSKDPLAGATVKYDKNKGVMSDASGHFSLTVPAGEHEVTISFVGYKTAKQTVTVKDGETLNLDIPLNPSAFQMNQVVTVSQYGKNAAKETVSMTVISREQIQNTNPTDVADLVSRAPGVLVQDGQISIRGLSSFSYGVGSRTTLLVDGMNLTSPDLQQTQNNLVPLENVKQVEIVKGAASVLYGSNSLDGVVNVITEWPIDNDPKTEIETNVGVYDQPKQKNQKWWDAALPFFGSINVNHQRRFGPVQFICGGNITSSNSFLEHNNEYRMRGFFKMRYIHPKISGLSFGLNGSFMLERIDQFFISKNLDSLALVPADYSSSNYELTTIDPFVTYATLKGHQYKLQMRYMNIFRKGNGQDANAISHYLEIDNQYQYHYHKNLLVFTAGAPFNCGIESSNLYTGNHFNFASAVYGQGEVNYKMITFQAGLRYEVSGVDTFIIKSKPVFRTGLNIQAAKATFFRFSWGQGYRVPSVAEKYLAQNFVSNIVIVPNDTLKAESAWSLELGFAQGFVIGKTWKVLFDAAFYWQQYNNYIEYIIGEYPNRDSHGTPFLPATYEFPPHSGVVLGPRPFNVGKARIAGYELSLNSDGKIGPIGVKISASYNYNFPNDLSASSRTGYNTGDYLKDMFKYNFQKVSSADSTKLLPFSIRHLLHADVELSYKKFYVGTTLSYYSVPEVVPVFFEYVSTFIFNNPYAVNQFYAKHKRGDFIADLRAGVKINDHFAIGFIVKNVGNLFYELRPGIASPIRNYTVQFRYNF